MKQYKYRVNERGEIIGVYELGKGGIIPLDSGNADFKAYEEWLAQGNITLPADSE